MGPTEVKKLRESLSLTQEQLSEQVGVARNTVARWEMGLHPVSAPVERLLRTLATEKSAPKSRRK